MAQPRTADRRGRRAPWWGPPAVVAVMALLVAGWPFLASRLSDDRALPDGAVLRVGPGNGDHAWFTLGGGWTLAESETTPSQEYVLTRGSTELSVAYLSLMSSDYTDRLWDGLRRSARVSSSDARLGPPAPVVSANGARGSIGDLTQGDERGTAAVYPAPNGSFAIRMIALAPSDTGSDTDTDTEPGAGTSTGTNTDTGTGSSTGSSTGTGTGSSTRTGTRTAADADHAAALAVIRSLSFTRPAP